MQNRSFAWIFVILLTLAVLYSLSFGLVSSRFEKQAHQIAVDSVETLGLTDQAKKDSTVASLERKILRDSSEAKLYPIMGHTYSYLKQHELNLGLDLQGGMSVTLEVSIPDLVLALSDNNPDQGFQNAVSQARDMQKSSTDDYITLFEKAWKSQSGGKELWRVFNNIETQDKFKAGMSDDDVIKVLRKEASDAIDNTENIIKKRVDQFGVTQPNIQKQSLTGRIIVELPGVNDRERVRKNLKSTANLEFWDCYFNTEVINSLVSANEALGRKMASGLFVADSAKAEIDSLTLNITKDTTLTAEKKDSLIKALSANGGVKADSLLTREELRRKNPLFSLLDVRTPMGTAMVGFARPSDTTAINKLLKMEEARNAMPADLRLFWSAKADQNVSTLYAIRDAEMRGKAPLDGKSIVDARQDFDPTTGDVVVEMSMDSEVGTPTWRMMTEKNASDKNRPIAIVMDNLVYSAPSVNSAIPNGRSVITFGDQKNREKSIEEAADLAGLLKAGSLPAPAKIIDESTVGPSLGEENIKAGLWSFIIAFVVILLYMLFYYAWAGWAANVALIANLFFLVGALVSLGGSLTLPGIAGIVLTMGMAVDANVLIYERVKEEMRAGKGINAALKDGFLKAVSAIIDGNATTLITGLVLLAVGTGPIKGFATTLIIGIFTTLFTALLISRLILYRRLNNKKPITFYSNITKDWFTKMNYDFVGKRRLYYIISIVIIGAGIASWVTRGFNMGVEFSGGSSSRVTFAEKISADQVRNAADQTLVYADGQKATATVQSVGSDGKSFKLTTNYMSDTKEVNADELIAAKFKETYDKIGVNYTIDSNNKVDASMSDDFRAEATWAGIVSLILVGIYILIRFQKWDFAVGATVALFHDALVVIAAFTLLNGLVPFTLEVNQNFIGAILTVIGYSINDTVVIFDRIREYLKARKNAPLEGTINDALNSTMGRSINTSMTVLLTLVVMFVFGSDDIKGFCFAMIIGVLSGVYSTLFIATPIVIDMRKWLGKKQDATTEA
jgi:SecD/SecF fusion protein